MRFSQLAFQTTNNQYQAMRLREMLQNRVRHEERLLASDQSACSFLHREFPPSSLLFSFRKVLNISRASKLKGTGGEYYALRFLKGKISLLEIQSGVLVSSLASEYTYSFLRPPQTARNSIFPTGTKDVPALLHLNM